MRVAGDCLGAPGCRQRSTHYHREDAPLSRDSDYPCARGTQQVEQTSKARLLNNTGRELNPGLCLALPMRGSSVLKALE